MDTFFSIASSDIINEIVDDEVIIINFKKGIYYSLNGAGVDIWTLLLNIVSQSQVVSFLSNKYTASEGQIELAVKNLFSQFESEQLITSVPESALDISFKIESPKEVEKQPFKMPVFESYTELQEMLLLDPIHDVDKLGWPVAERVS